MEIAQNPENITFLEKADHRALHSANGGTNVPIAAKILGGVAVGLEFIEQNFPNTIGVLDALDPVGTLGLQAIEQLNYSCERDLNCI